MNKVEKNLKGMGIILGIIIAVIFCIWFFTSLTDYMEYKKYIDGATANGGSSLEIYTRYGDIAYDGKIGMMSSLIFGISGIIASVLLYAFGEVLGLLQKISNKLGKDEEIEIEIKETENEIVLE